MIPILARTRLGLAAARRGAGAPVVLVPTMGALHAGHRALLRHALQIARPNGSVVASVFVNPLQFGPGEDLDRYPRDLDDDVRICGEEGVSVVFAPGTAQMYPQEQLITIDPGPMGQVLEGAFRPGFFTGVLTVVLKLFDLVQPDVAVFGEKDAQQLALVRRMTADLDLGIAIASVPTVRDPDGLAVSSRNKYLSAAERGTALALPAALRGGREAQNAGPEAVLKAAGAILDEAATADPPLVTDYLALVEPGSFEPVTPGYAGEALLLAAARSGRTRLIDNMPLVLGAQSEPRGRPCC
ncbi:MAG TPA: pantoate--beta-alanine ligase [Streptosporangiaceae bacterium]|nr:pantoate--beta-alanine ligase [Streptosporangiaceae bacterium]